MSVSRELLVSFDAGDVFVAVTGDKKEIVILMADNLHDRWVSRSFAISGACDLWRALDTCAAGTVVGEADASGYHCPPCFVISLGSDYTCTAIALLGPVETGTVVVELSRRQTQRLADALRDHLDSIGDDLARERARKVAPDCLVLAGAATVAGLSADDEKV